jgi:SagB-type dehydrogenase family enzyme
MNKQVNIGDHYHSETKYYRDRNLGGGVRWAERSEPYKTYPGAEIVSLPEPTHSAEKSIWDVLAGRRSLRNYIPAAVSMEDLSQLLWGVQGVTAHAGQYALRTAPSAGALYPIETYVLVNRVDELAAGIYHYDVRQHRLEVVRKGSFGAEAAQAALGQGMLQSAALVLLWTAVIARSKWKYRERAYRYIYMDAGHIGQNAYLAAEALGLGCCTVGAFFDDEVNSLIGIDGKDEIAVYLCSVGKTRM